MNELNEKIKIIEDQWKEIYDRCSATPNLYKPYLTEISIDDVGNVVLIVLEWLKNSNDNSVGKIYALSKQVMITSLKTMMSNLNSLYMGQYTTFNQFVINLNQLLISLFRLTFLNKKSVAPAELQLKNSENLAMLKDLSEKIDNEENKYKSIIKYAETIDAQKSEIDKTLTSSKKELENLNKNKEEIKEELSAITETISEIKSNHKEMNGFKEEANELLENNKTVKEQLEKLTTECEELKKRVSDYISGYLVSLVLCESARTHFKTTRKIRFQGSAV
jgi:DNA repair exonuclease SbcCD ATPase subunit